jgi:hypothetical protein
MQAHDETAENVGFDACVDGNLVTAQHGAQRVAELLQLGGRKRNGRGDRRGGLAAAGGEFGQERRGHRRQIAGAAVGGHSTDEIARQTGNASGVEHGQQRLALQGARNDRAGNEPCEIRALGDHLAKGVEVLRDLIEGLRAVRELKKGAGVASGNAGGCGGHVESLSPAAERGRQAIEITRFSSAERPASLAAPPRKSARCYHAAFPGATSAKHCSTAVFRRGGVRGRNRGRHRPAAGPNPEGRSSQARRAAKAARPYRGQP